MSQKLNQLVELARLRDAGSITEDEFERLKAEALSGGEAATPEAVSDESQSWVWEKAKQVTADYPRLVGTAAGLAIVGSMVLIYITGDHGSTQVSVPSQTEAATNPETGLPGDSLGVEFTEVASLWNGLDQPPIIDGAIARSPETGAFDSFSHRFDGSSVLAGAYDPADDAVYALMVRASLTHPDVNNMYLHVCFMLHPYSPECISAFWDEGMDQALFEDYLEEDHFATWDFEGNEWRLEIVEGVQTLRVISPGSTRVVS